MKALVKDTVGIKRTIEYLQTCLRQNLVFFLQLLSLKSVFFKLYFSYLFAIRLKKIVCCHLS